MLPDLMPGAEYNKDLEAILKTTLTAAGNARSAGGAPRERVERYLTFCAESVTRLRHAVRPSGLDDLLLTKRYWTLLAMDPTSRAAGELVDAELNDCEARFGEAVNDVHDERERWRLAGELIVPDTNVLLHSLDADTTIRNAPWRQMAKVREMETVTVVLLLAVIDELDRRKRTNDRSAARKRLKEINGALGSALNTVLVPSSGDHGRVDVAIMVDPPGHQRLPHNDSEIIDRTLSLGYRTIERVHLLTGDTGMVIRAHQVDVLCHHVDTP